MPDVIASRDNPEWFEVLGQKRAICVSEQGPGYFRTRLVRGGPWVLVRVMWEHGVWTIFVNGDVAKGSGTDDPWDCPFYRRGPFTEIWAEDYHRLMREYKAAPPGHPLRNPGERVDLRAAPPLYRGKS